MLTDSKQNAVEIYNFTKFYGDFASCKNVNFTAKKGSITGILGENGAGKTTLLKAICGLHYPSEGRILVCGSEDAAFFRKQVGFVPETPELPASFTVLETLFFSAKQSLANFDKSESKEKIAEAIKECSLQDVINLKVKQLSKGFKQRLSLANALVKNPEVFILDEFSSGLDPAQMANLRILIKKIAKKKAVILSTHRIEEANQLCDSIYILKKGEIVASGSLSEILLQTKTKSLEKAFLLFSGEKK